ncbi:MAG: hypothetical protein HY279_07195 [Nitrospinae bacterium]|nr:hypothetical protein [Nitrospinota bacterium]
MARIMAGKDTGIPDMCHPEHSGIGETWIQPEERSCYGNGKGKRKGYKGNKPCFKLY